MMEPAGEPQETTQLLELSLSPRGRHVKSALHFDRLPSSLFDQLALGLSRRFVRALSFDREMDLTDMDPAPPPHSVSYA